MRADSLRRVYLSLILVQFLEFNYYCYFLICRTSATRILSFVAVRYLLVPFRRMKGRFCYHIRGRGDMIGLRGLVIFFPPIRMRCSISFLVFPALLLVRVPQWHGKNSGEHRYKLHIAAMCWASTPSHWIAFKAIYRSLPLSLSLSLSF